MGKQMRWIAATLVAIVVGVWWLTTHHGPGDGVGPIREMDIPVNVPVASTPAQKTNPAVDTSSTITPAPANASASTAADVPHPIEVTPGFEYLAPKTPLADTDPRFVNVRRHEQLQAEPRDTAWSERTETALRTAIESELTAKGLDNHRIELPVVECRTNACEIQAYGYTNAEMDFSEFQQIGFRALNGSVRDEFDPNSQIMNVGMDPPEVGGTRAILLAQLPRKKP